MNSLIKKISLRSTIIYFFGLILIYSFFLIKKIVSDLFFISIILSLFIILFLVIVKKFQKGYDLPNNLKKGEKIRYIMLCHSCNWEWMSNTSGIESPTKCPNCGNKSKLELIGWRKLQSTPKQTNRELTKFFKI